jgi:hypothetical protein
MTAARNLHGPLSPATIRGGVFASDDVLPATSPMVAGTGITTGTGTVYRNQVYRIGDVIKTEIFVDLTGLNSNAAADIIGVNGGTANCHIGQITTTQNGLIYKTAMSCVETPATGEPDVDLYAADEATGAEDTAVTSLTNDAIIVDTAADWTKGLSKLGTGNVSANQYLYLVGSGGGTDATYTAGQFVIELWGFVV